MDTIPIPLLLVALIILIIFSSFFSGSETGMMALNRYRLRHLVKDKKRGAVLADQLLRKPDRLIGVILFGNNVVNFFAASIGTIIGLRLLGDYGAIASPFIIAIIFIIFAEMVPKTFAVTDPERVAFPSAYILAPLLYICYPVVYFLNKISNGLLACLRVNNKNNKTLALSQDELKTIVYEAGKNISNNHRDMLLGILDMEKITVNDIMVNRNNLVGINLDGSIEDIHEQLTYCQYTWLIVYRQNMDNIVGILRDRRALKRLISKKDNFTYATIEELCEEPDYIPEGTSLYTQMLKFQQQNQRVGLVINEYGLLQGMVTINNIIEEIIGEFPANSRPDIRLQEDGSFLLNGSATIRDVNRHLHCELSTDGPKTVNGLILEYLQDIPRPGTSLRINNYAFEITQVLDNAVKKVKVLALPDDKDD